MTQVNDHIYLLDDNKEATGYLVVGSDKAAVIDTMNGMENLYDIVRELTDKELIVINTHGHPDHIMGNIFFDKAYMHPADNELAAMFCSDSHFQERCEKLGLKMPPFSPMKQGDIFDLGGLTLEVFECPGHTAGSVLLLLREDRMLFTGDAINHHLWLQLEGCDPLPKVVDTVKSCLFLEDKADYILHGHAWDKEHMSLMRAMIDGIQEIIDGKTENDEKYEWFGSDDAVIHVYQINDGKIYLQDHHAIVYTP